MNIKKRFVMRIDELNYAIETAYGYRFGEFDKELKTPDKYDEIDELITAPDFEGFDLLKITPENVKTEKKSEKITDSNVILPKKKAQELEDDILEYLIFAYTDGIDAVNEMLTSNVVADADGIFLAINEPTAGKTYIDRLEEHIANGDINGIKRVAETEFHRVFNRAITDGGKEAGASYKKWSTMMDEKVRDTHDYLEGVKIPFDEKFYTYDGDSAFAPSGFELAENNVNCRCYLELF